MEKIQKNSYINFLNAENEHYKKKSKTSLQMKNTLIIGWNRESQNLFDKTNEYPALGYDVKGFVSVNKNPADLHYKNVPLLGDLSDLSAWVHFYNIEEILIAVDPSKHSKLNDILKICQQTNTHYKIVSDVYDTVYGNVIHDIHLEIFRKRDFGVRRLLELFGSLILMVFLSPIFFLTTIAIKFESRGSIFYSQLRVGKDGKPFRIYKFRSMIQNAEKKSGPVWAQKNDPRITQVGRFMRLSRIDELPQLINVLKGDMSFIGPRPERPFFVDSFKQQIPLYVNRLEVKPGVTGWAQVKWRYDETLDDVKEKLKYDLYYVNNRNLFLEIKILFLTFGTVLLAKGQ